MTKIKTSFLKRLLSEKDAFSLFCFHRMMNEKKPFLKRHLPDHRRTKGSFSNQRSSINLILRDITSMDGPITLKLLQEWDNEDNEEDVRRKKRKISAVNHYMETKQQQHSSSTRMPKTWRIEGRIGNTKTSVIQNLQLLELMDLKENNPKKFTRMLRLCPEDFDNLLFKIRPILSPTPKYNSVDPIVKLICTLRFLAGGIYEDICWAWKMNKNSFYQFLHECLAAIDVVLKNIDHLSDKETLFATTTFNALAKFSSTIL